MLRKWFAISLHFYPLLRTPARAFTTRPSHSLLRPMAVHAPNIMSHHDNVRVDLFFKSSDELKKRVTWLVSQDVKAFNVVNKHKDDSLVDWASQIRSVCPDADVCVHYALKNQKVSRGSPRDHFQKLQKFWSSLPSEHTILLVSGSQSTEEWNSAVALQKLKEVRSDRKVAVAYNPFFPDQEDRHNEWLRLEQKIASGLVGKIYLQFGTDPDLLEKALHKLQPLCEKHEIQLAASVFLPTKQLIAQQNFRPWKGVYLSDNFLAGPEQARHIVVRLLCLHRKYNVQPLIEAPGVRKESDLELVKSILQARDDDEDESGDSTSKDNPVANNRKSTGKTQSKNEHLVKKQKMSNSDHGGKQRILAPAVQAHSLSRPAVVLFGTHDIRIHDNEALLLACHHNHVLPVFLWQVPVHHWGARGALQVVLKEALHQLSLQLSQESINLPLVCGNTADSVSELCKIASEIGASAVYWNREMTPESREMERHRATSLKQLDIAAVACQSALLYDVEKLELDEGFHGGHWGTLMPFKRACEKQLGKPDRPILMKESLACLYSVAPPPQDCKSVPIEELGFETVPPSTKWDEPIRERFPMIHYLAQRRLDHFLIKGLPLYESDRSRADMEYATSQLSVYLRIGIISPRELYWRIEDSSLSPEAKKTFARRLIWRELAYYQLFCFPKMRDRSIRKHYEASEWVTGDEEKGRFNAWKRGLTGYPLVDAGMRELYTTGYLTQSVRMVVASFLVEYLRVDWTKGAEWFHYTLADADSAINSMMWQNAGRSGIDQWNFVLSPENASQDPYGEYTRKWVPELSPLPLQYLQRPWQTFEGDLRMAGIVLGETYPHRIVQDLKGERQKSVESVLAMRRRSQEKNDENGYDLIDLPTGIETVVFTKKEYRIDRLGKVLQGKPKTATSTVKRRKTKRTTKTDGRRKNRLPSSLA